MFETKVTKQSFREAQRGTRSGRGLRRLVVFLTVALLTVLVFDAPTGAVEKKKKAKTSSVQKKRAKKATVRKATPSKRTAKKRTVKRATSPRKTTTRKSARPPAGRYHNFIDNDHNGIDDRAQRTVNKLGKPAARLSRAKAAKKATTARKTTAKRAASAKKSAGKATVKKKTTSKKKSKAKKSRNYKKKKP